MLYVLGNLGVPSIICKKEGLYAVEEGRLTPSPVSIEIPIECNHKYCRSISHLGRGITCWKCRINRDEFVTIDRENRKEVECDVSSLGSNILDALEEDDSL